MMDLGPSQGMSFSRFRDITRLTNELQQYYRPDLLMNLSRRRMVLAAGMVGGVSGCTTTLETGPTVVAATTHIEHLGEVETPIDVAMVQVEAEVHWDHLPSAVTEISGALYADDHPNDALGKFQNTGEWEPSDDEEVYVEGDLMTVYEPDAFGVGEHTVDCRLHIMLHAKDESFDETVNFSVTFEILEREEDDPAENGEDKDDDPSEEDEEDASMQVETFHVGASDSGEPRPSLDGADGDVMGTVVATGGTPDLIAFGLRYVEFTYDGLDPDEIGAVGWYGEVVGTDEIMRYDSSAGTAGDPEWPDEGEGSYGPGDDQIYDTDPARVDDDEWLTQFEVDEPGTTEQFPVDFEITVTLHNGEELETVSDELSLTQYLDVHYPEPETETEIDISGYVEHLKKQV